MKIQKTIRQRVEELFGLPAMKMPWSLYLAQLNEAGKLTQRSIMDTMMVLLEATEQMEKDVEDIKYQLIQPTPPVEAVSTPDIKGNVEVKPLIEGLAVEDREGKLFCANCGTEIINTPEWKEKHLIECKSTTTIQDNPPEPSK